MLAQRLAGLKKPVLRPMVSNTTASFKILTKIPYYNGIIVIIWDVINYCGVYLVPDKTPHLVSWFHSKKSLAVEILQR